MTEVTLRAPAEAALNFSADELAKLTTAGRTKETTCCFCFGGGSSSGAAKKDWFGGDGGSKKGQLLDIPHDDAAADYSSETKKEDPFGGGADPFGAAPGPAHDAADDGLDAFGVAATAPAPAAPNGGAEAKATGGGGDLIQF